MNNPNSFPLFIATADPTLLLLPAEGTNSQPAMSLFREQYVTISSGTGIVATVGHPNAAVDYAPANVNSLFVAGFNYAYMNSANDSGGWRSIEAYYVSGVGFGDIDPAEGTGTHAYLLNAAIGFSVARVDEIAEANETIRTTSDGHDAAQFGLQGVVARLQAFNGATFDRIRTASAAVLAAFSSIGALLVSRPGEWAVNHTPAANTQATITKAAGAAGVRHVCTSISATLIGLAASAEATVLVNLRDGATGAGTILQSWRLLVVGGAGSETGIALTGLNIPGTAATAMTLEFAAAGGASTFETVAMTGYDAS